MRSFIALFALLALLGSGAQSETIIPGGPVSGTWNQAGSPYIVEGQIEIPDGETLTIEPGVQVTFAGHYKFRVQGRLLAVGSEADSIRFGAADTTVGWHGIRFEETPASNDSSLIIHCRIEYGQAQGDYPDCSGGAVFIKGFDKVRIAHCTLANNTAKYGGGVYCTSGGVIAHNTFTANVAIRYANLGGAGSALNARGTSAVVGNIMRDNWAWDLGATVMLGDAALLEGNVICDNNGKGVRCYAGCTSRLVNNVICNNNSNGILCGYDSALEIVGCVICNNHDSGICFTLAFATVINCTISSNTAERGGGMFCSESEPVFINTILWGNTADSGDQVYLHSRFWDSVNPDFFFCDIEGGLEAFGYYPGLGYFGRYEDNIDSDPHFAVIGGHPFALTEQSYCINAGRLAIEGLGLPVTDPTGAPRVYEGFRVDIGAYEFQGPPAFADMPLFAPDAGWYPIRQEITLECPTPDVSIHYTLDGSEPSQSSPLYSAPIPISSHTTIKAKAFHATLPPSLTATGAYRIGSDLAGRTTGTLTVDYSPYFAVDDLEIPIGEMLTIEAGVELIFAGHHKLDVQGRLVAEGTAEAEIRFTAQDPDTGWAGIRFDETAAVNDSSKLVHCVIEFGKAYGNVPDDYGGGVYVGGFSKLCIAQCQICSNSAFLGGGLACDGGASPYIVDNRFKANVATQRGGGLYCAASGGLIVMGNTFCENAAAQGGGLACFSCDSYIENNIFSGNLAVHGGGLIPAGGGMYIYQGQAVVQGNRVVGNTSANYGAGIHVERIRGTISGNVISGNVCQGNGGGLVCYVYSQGQIVNNLIYNNQAGGGGGLFISHTDDWQVTNNTVCHNSAQIIGGGLFTNGYCIVLRDCILWGNEAPDGPQIAIYDHPFVDIAFCDVQGGQAGIGGEPYQPYLIYVDNIDADPEFVGGGPAPYVLSSDSPCIDAGIPDTTGLNLPPFDLAGNPRIINDRVDMGAYEFLDPAAIEGGDATWAQGTLVFSLAPNHPNPFGSTTQITYAIPAKSHVSLIVYDLTGRLVRTLADEEMTAGRHEITWDGQDNRGRICGTGVYFARLKARDQHTTKRMVLLR